MTDIQPLCVPGGDPAAYFDYWAAQPTLLRSNSFRTQALIDACVDKKPSVWWKHDAERNCAKMHRPPRRVVPLGGYADIHAASIDDNQHPYMGNEGIVPARAPRLYIGKSTGSLLLTWDVRFSEGWFTHNGTQNAVKLWFIKLGTAGSPTGGPKDHSIIHMRLRPQAKDYITSAETCGTLFNDMDNGPYKSVPKPTGVYIIDPYQPTGLGAYKTGTYVVKTNCRTRFWYEIKLSVPPEEFTEWNEATGVTLVSRVTLDDHKAPDGTFVPKGTLIPYDMVSFWVADSTRPATRVLYRVPMLHHPGYPNIGQFNLVWDTSTENWNREQQTLRLGNIQNGNSFTITVPAFTVPPELSKAPNSQFPEFTTSEITCTGTTNAASDQMKYAIDKALTALPSIYSCTCSRIGSTGQNYRVTFSGVGTNSSRGFDMPLLQINPTGFTPGAVTEDVKGGIGEHVGLSEEMEAWLHFAMCHWNQPVDESDHLLFEQPIEDAV